ncbi:MAG: T9SS type A sorting domain-containing protein [Bacteroidia bacterium]|nr:T9SS type A sorting domain-containing protein [Bacteroidia bacterium]
MFRHYNIVAPTPVFIDSFGRIVEEINLPAGRQESQRVEINVKSFAAGFYFVRMMDESGQVVRKVVVQH